MTIKTTKYLNFAPEEIDWEVPQAIEHPPAISNQFEGLFDGFFWAIGIGVAGFFLLGILALIFPIQLEDSQPQEVQKVQQPSANRPVIVKTIQIDGVTIQLDREGNAYGLPEYLEFGNSTSPMRVFDAPGGRFIRVFPPNTPFVITKHTYETHWRWVTNFDRVSGFVNFQAPGFPGNAPQPPPEPKPATTNGPVFVKTLNINGMTAGLTQDGSMYGPIPIEYRFGYNMQPMQVFNAPGGKVTAVFPSKTPFVITRVPVQAHWRWVANFDGTQGYTTFKPSVLSD